MENVNPLHELDNPMAIGLDHSQQRQKARWVVRLVSHLRSKSIFMTSARGRRSYIVADIQYTHRNLICADDCGHTTRGIAETLDNVNTPRAHRAFFWIYWIVRHTDLLNLFQRNWSISTKTTKRVNLWFFIIYNYLFLFRQIYWWNIALNLCQCDMTL